MTYLQLMCNRSCDTHENTARVAIIQSICYSFVSWQHMPDVFVSFTDKN